jgi:hypothetical protein
MGNVFVIVSLRYEIADATARENCRPWPLARARVGMALVVAHGAQADPWQLARARVGMVLPMGNMLFCERQFKGNAFFSARISV